MKMMPAHGCGNDATLHLGHRRDVVAIQGFQGQIKSLTDGTAVLQQLGQLDGVVYRVVSELHYEVLLHGIEVPYHGLHLLWGRAELLPTLQQKQSSQGRHKHSLENLLERRNNVRRHDP